MIENIASVITLIGAVLILNVITVVMRTRQGI